MSVDADISIIASLLASRSRADMALSLLGGEARTAGELARASGMSASAASAHLTKLVDGDLLAVEHQGRHRYYRLKSPAVAEFLETMLTIAPVRAVSGLRESISKKQLCLARTCYDHLAGELGVQLFDKLLEQNLLLAKADGIVVQPLGETVFAEIGIDLHGLRSRRRPLAKVCLDWTERRYHLAGSLGASILENLLITGVLSKEPGNRVLHVSEQGTSYLQDIFGIKV